MIVMPQAGRIQRTRQRGTAPRGGAKSAIGARPVRATAVPFNAAAMGSGMRKM
jgi:hypothetical protein